MQQSLLVRLRPTGPWRYGPSDGASDRVDTTYRSDRLFSAVTLAMRQLGLLDSWLDATARSQKSAVAFTSLFPFQGDSLYITPPANLWPPPSSLVNSTSPVFLTKVRWRAAYFVPVSLVDALMTGQSVLADQWIPDPESGCLLRRDRPSSSPFRTVARAFAPVDRLSLTSADADPHACVEFESGSGLWTLARFFDDAAHEAWNQPLRAAFRLLGDTGLGGGRSKGWGQMQTPEFETGTWPALILPKVARAAKNASEEQSPSRSYWLLSLYSPAIHDTVNWSGGQYELTVRNGRVDGSSGALKKSVRMVVEGCVLDADSEPVGTAVDVAPPGFAHPVYRSGIALSLLIPPPKPVTERAIEAIVPPELEATPFPMPPAESSAPSQPITPPELAELPEPTAYSPHSTQPEPVERTEDAEPIEPAEPAEHAEPLQHPTPSRHSDTLEPYKAPENSAPPEHAAPAEHSAPADPQPHAPLPELAPQIQTEPIPEPHPQPTPHPEPEFSLQPHPAPELPHQHPADPAPEIVPEVVPEIDPQPVPRSAPETTPEPESQPHPEITPEHLPEPVPELPHESPGEPIHELTPAPIVEVVPENSTPTEPAKSQEDTGHEI